MKTNFPRSFDDLTINVVTVFGDSRVGNATQPDCLKVQSVHLAHESLECSVALESGEVLIYRFQPNSEVQHVVKESDAKIILLDPSLSLGRKFRPYVMLQKRPSETTSHSLSDIGFLAVGYADGFVLVVDMRDPSVLHVPPTAHSRNGSSRFPCPNDPVVDGIVSLTWTVSGISSDTQLAVRLIAVHASGTTSVFKLARAPDTSSYSIVEAVSAMTLPNLLTNCSYMIDSETGASMYADRAGFAAALRGGIMPQRCFWVTASARGAQCQADITGDIVGKVKWDDHKMVNALIVERNGSQSLVAYGNEGEVLVHTIPHLESLHVITLSPKPESPISVDKTGYLVYCDAMTNSRVQSTVTLATLFSSGHAYDDPFTALMEHATTISPQHQSAHTGWTSLLATWFHSTDYMTGERLDSIFAGYDRTVPIGTSNKLQKNQPDPAGFELPTTQPVQTVPFQRLHSALAERGQMLEDLERHLDSLTQGTQDMVAQAKRLAAEQEAKKWFGF